MSSDEYQEASARRLYAELQRRRVTLTLEGYDAWVVLSAIQLTCTHPGLGADLKARLERIGRRVQEVYADVPWVAVLAEAGWHRMFDQPLSPPEGES